MSWLDDELAKLDRQAEAKDAQQRQLAQHRHAQYPEFTPQRRVTPQPERIHTVEQIWREFAAELQRRRVPLTKVGSGRQKIRAWQIGQDVFLTAEGKLYRKAYEHRRSSLNHEVSTVWLEGSSGSSHADARPTGFEPLLYAAMATTSEFKQPGLLRQRLARIARELLGRR